MAFAQSWGDFQADYSQCLDTLIAAKYDPNTWKEENEKKIAFNEFMWTYETKQIEETKTLCDELDKEFVLFEEAMSKAIKLSECERELDAEKADCAEAHTKLELVENDTNALRATHECQLATMTSLQSSLSGDRRCRHNNDNVEITIIEKLLGLKSVDEQPLEPGHINIMFMSLPDECLYWDDKQQQSSNKQSMQPLKLSTELLDRYRALHKKRKHQNNQVSAAAAGTTLRNAPNGLVVTKISDFKTIHENFQTLMCSYLTKQEIEKAGKRFGLDWIEDSPVISILIDSKATKMATIVLPKYYPLCGTSLIKLTSLTGYDNAAIKNFRIEKNLNSLVEWIERFIELYNTNQLES